MVMGLRGLANLVEGLRYSPPPFGNVWVSGSMEIFRRCKLPYRFVSSSQLLLWLTKIPQEENSVTSFIDITG